MPLPLVLFFIIFLEGYVVLSTELLAIRLLIPFTGSGTDTVSIVIAAVLMPLAFGYYAGGRFRPRENGRLRATVRKKLIFNLVTAAVILTPGLSYAVLDWLFDVAYRDWHINNRLVLTTMYSALFLVYPVFLLGQTVPLVSNYFAGNRLPVMAGKILFISTLGSFMGAIFCTLVLMTWLGVHTSAAVTVACLVLPVIILSKRRISPELLAALACLAAAFALNSGAVMRKHDVVANNRHHLIQVTDVERTRFMKIDHTNAAGIERGVGSMFQYIQFIERTYIEPLIWDGGPPREILVMGAGGFTLGMNDMKNDYVYIDLDPDLQQIAEDEFLDAKLGPNKKFVPLEARAFLYQNDRKFDLIMIDLFRGPGSSPEHLVTQEFFIQVKDALKPGGIVVANYLASPNFSDPFTITLDNTIRSVFKNVGRQSLQDYLGWEKEPPWINVIYSYYHNPDAPTGIYTDDKNTSLFDKPGRVN